MNTDYLSCSLEDLSRINNPVTVRVKIAIGKVLNVALLHGNRRLRSCSIRNAIPKVAVHRLRKRFRDALCEEIAQTVADEKEVDGELRALYAALEDRP